MMNMNTIKNKLLDIFYPSNYAFAHCDIPCGIYDPNDAIQAAQTCIRMTELILEKQNDDSLSGKNSLSTGSKSRALNSSGGSP